MICFKQVQPSKASWYAFFFLLFLSACGQGDGIVGGTTQETAPVSIRLVFEADEEGGKQKLFAVALESISSVRITAKGEAISTVTNQVDASPGAIVPIELDIPTGVEVNILVEILDSNGDILLSGQEKTVIRNTGLEHVIEVTMGELLTLFVNPVIISQGNTSLLSLSLSEAFLSDLSVTPSFTWTIDTAFTHLSEIPVSQGNLVVDPTDSTKAIYTAPSVIPSNEVHLHLSIRVSSDDKAGVFKTTLLFVGLLDEFVAETP